MAFICINEIVSGEKNVHKYVCVCVCVCGVYLL